jgi:hypothetical protein
MSVVFAMPYFWPIDNSNVVGNENIFFYPCRGKKIYILMIFSKNQANLGAYALDFNVAYDWRGARVLSIPFIQEHLY